MTENRKTFFDRLEPCLAPSDLLDVQLAYSLAKFGHRAQARKELGPAGERVRYFEHVRRVALILIDEVKIVEPGLVITALLHDGPEDTKDVNPAIIEHCFGHKVATSVKALSKTPKEGYLERFNACTLWQPYIVKGCDRLDNLRSLWCCPDDFRAKQVAETREKYFPLFDRMMHLVPIKHRERAAWLRDAVRRETERQATLLETSHEQA